MDIDEALEGRPVRRAGEPARGLVEEAIVEEIRPSSVYLLRRSNQELVLAHPPGAQARNFVRLRPGDRVRVALSPRDPRRGRIVEWIEEHRR